MKKITIYVVVLLILVLGRYVHAEAREIEFSNKLVKFIDAKSDSKLKYNRHQILSPLYFDLKTDSKVDVKQNVSGAAHSAKNPPVNVAKVAFKTGISLQECKLPKVIRDSEVIVLSGYEGTALSTVAVGGPDISTSVAVVNIEEGTTPLYIFVTAYDSIVWKLTGATQRVKQFVAHQRVSIKYLAHQRKSIKGVGVGVVGLPKANVSFAENCVRYFTTKKEGRSQNAVAKITAALGQKVNHVFGTYNLRNVSLPSGSVDDNRRENKVDHEKFFDQAFTLKGGKKLKLNSKIDAETMASLFRFNSDGIYQIDSKQIVSEEPAESYDVLPQEAGLLQLIAEDRIERVSKENYIIKKNIERYPAGLSGAHAVNFIIAKGVNIPDGNPGHSIVCLEETGECFPRGGVVDN